MLTKSKHPVWDVYDEYRTARLNVRYYEKQLSKLRRNNILVEIVLAVSVSSGVAGLWIWETVVGGIIWKALATLAAFLAVIKPIVKLSDQVQKKSQVLTNWRLLDDGLQQLILAINAYGKYDDEMRNSFLTLMKTKTTIIKEEPTEGVDEKLRRLCFEQVKRELPSDSFFIPEE